MHVGFVELTPFLSDMAADPIEIHRAGSGDSEVIAGLNAHVQGLHAALIPERFKPAGRDSLLAREVDTWLARPENIVLLARVGARPAGYAYAEVRRRGENVYAYAYDEVYLHHLSVDPARRRCGVGTALLAAVAEVGRAMGIERLALDVWTVNADAAAFFRAQGFAPYNERLARGGWGIATDRAEPRA